jgi:hypothetical protein
MGSSFESVKTDFSFEPEIDLKALKLVPFKFRYSVVLLIDGIFG